METLYNIVLSALPEYTIYWTLKGFMRQRIMLSGKVIRTWTTWSGRKFHHVHMPEFHSVADICDFYNVEIETAYHMAYRNGWKVK